MKSSTSLLTLLTILLGALPAWAQERCAEETREIRIYLIDRESPDRGWDDTVASITLTQPNGRAETFLVPRAAKSPGFAASSAPGILRGMTGSPYFVELVTVDPAETTDCPDAIDPEAVPQEPKAQEQPLSPVDVLRQVHQGVCFIRKVPASFLTPGWTATITIRLSDFTFTSEGFQASRIPAESAEKTLANVEAVFGKLREQPKAEGAFMALRPVVVDLFRELAKLGPAAFLDATGTIEKDRQWCLATARAIEESCYHADAARIQELSLQCGPRLKEMRDTVARSSARPSEELPAK